MRSQHQIIIIGICFIAWIILMAVGPTTYKQVSAYELLGWMFFASLGYGMYGGQLMFKMTHRFSAPNMTTTLMQPQPVDTIELPIPNTLEGLRLTPEDIEKMSDAERSNVVMKTCPFGIWAMGGSHVGPLRGGGKDNGYFVAPLDLVCQWEGELSQVRANVNWVAYCEEPDRTRGEHDLMELPQPIYERVKRIDGFHRKAIVRFGYSQWQAPDEEKERHRHLEYVVGKLELANKKLLQDKEELLDAITKGGKAFGLVTGSWGKQSNNATSENKESMLDAFRRNKEE